MEKLISAIINRMICAGSIKQEEKELYAFGLEAVLSCAVTLFSTALIGLFLGQLVGAFFFMLFFIPLRSYAGGYHAQTHMGCYLLSCAVTIAVLLLADQFSGFLAANTVVFITLTIFSALLVMVLAPVETPNKPLDALERSVYTFKTRLVLGVEMLCYIALMLVKNQYLAFIIMLNFVVMAISLCVGKSVISRHTLK